MSTPSYPSEPDRPAPEPAGQPPAASPGPQPGYAPAGYPPQQQQWQQPGPGYPGRQPVAYGQRPPVAAGSPENPTRNPLGLVSAIVGAVPLLLGFIGPFLPLVFLNAGNFGVYAVVTGVLNGLTLVVGIAALVIGLIAITRKGLPKAFAGIGVGLGVAATWGGLTGFLYPFVADLTY